MSLNSYRRSLKKHMYGARDRYTLGSRAYNALDRPLTEYLDKAFPNDTPMWPKIKDAAHSMTCPTIGDSGLTQLKCCLGSCSNCPPLPKLDAEKYTGLDSALSRMIVWSQFEKLWKCKLHGKVDAKECPLCLVLPQAKQPEKKPRKELEYVQKRAPIGTFIKEVFQPFLLAYRYHLFLYIVLGSYHCIKTRKERFMETGTPVSYTHLTLPTIYSV